MVAKGTVGEHSRCTIPQFVHQMVTEIFPKNGMDPKGSYAIVDRN